MKKWKNLIINKREWVKKYKNKNVFSDPNACGIKRDESNQGMWFTPKLDQ